MSRYNGIIKERSKYNGYYRNEKSYKKYADFTAVSDVTMHIPKGKVYGLLGPNGAGKSTIMKMFLGLTNPTSGGLTIDDKNILKIEMRS